MTNNGVRVLSERKKSHELAKKQRENGELREKWILEDSRSSDRKKGRHNDLTREWIKSEIERGCSYCQEKNVLMTLDRIDNSVGHVKTNCRPACVRCNRIRGNMPFAAWMCVVDGVRKANELGLFGDWIGPNPKMKSLAA